MTSTMRFGSNDPKTAVIVTSYNHQAYVEQCLDSIAAQTRSPHRVIVVDDFSTDDSANVIQWWLSTNKKEYEFIRHERNLGLCASLNEALALVDADYFIHVSADDWVEKDRIEVQSRAFDLEDETTALIVGDIRETDAGGVTLANHDFAKRLGHLTGEVMQPMLLHHLLIENVIPAPGVMMRTKLVREVGGYDESLSFEDYELWLRLSVKYSIAHLPKIVANYRVVNSSLTRHSGRRVSLLASEAAILARRIGINEMNDSVISQRLVNIAIQLIELGDIRALRKVMESASRASQDPCVRQATKTILGPFGLSRIRSRYGDKFAAPVG